MANNKVKLSDGTVLLDLTADTATAADVAKGKTFHLANGESAIGTMTTESPVVFDSTKSISSLVSQRGKTVVLNAGSAADVSIAVAGADSTYETGFEIAILPYDIQSAVIKITSGKICAVGLTSVLEASQSTPITVTLEKYVMIALKKLDSSLWVVTGQCEITQ